MKEKLSYQKLEQKVRDLEHILIELKNKESELEEHRQKLKLAMEAANYFSFEIDLTQLKISTSTDLYESLGYPPETIAKLIEKAGSLVHPGDYQQMKNHILSFQKNQPLKFNFEFRIKHHNRRWIWFSGTGRNTEWDQQGNPLRILGLLKNIQEEKEAQNKLTQSEEKFKSLATLLPEVIYETDKKGNLTFVNLKAYEIFEYTPEDFKKGLNALQMIAPEDVDRARENIQKVLEKDNSKGIEYTAITKKGKRFPVLVYSNPIRHNKKTIGLRGIIVDISSQKNLIKRLERSETNFHQLADNINDAFWLRTLDHKIIYMNPACEKIVGKQFKNIFEDFNEYEQWIHPEDKEKIIQQKLKNNHLPQKTHLYQHRIIRPDGQVRWLWVRTFPVFNENGELYRRAGIASDITEEKLLLEQLTLAKEKAEESDRLKSAFLANMSHEIRTPMNGILGFSELLKDPFLRKEEKESYIKIINSNGRQLLNLIDDIIDLAKIEAQQLTINKTMVSLNTIMDDVYLLFKQEQQRLKKEHIKLILNKEKVSPHIYTDSIRLKQILNNLLSNAFKFTNQGQIKFGYQTMIHKKNTFIRFFVTDSGIGIPREKSSIIFKRFGQIYTADNKTRQGTGLGLTICKGLTELLGGKIWFESSHAETTFYFTIPGNNACGQHQDEHQTTIKPFANKWNNIGILVVEDNEDNLSFLCTLLEKNGAKVFAAKTGEDAIDMIKVNPTIQIVLMDIQLPQMDGFETTQKIKAINPNLPVIAQTAYALSNDRAICLKSGCDDYVAKPLKKDILFQKINHYIYK
ncbi:MAG: PAS domain-containing protein [Bacteroidales bacterium]|jgi:PAS domain S-box-containing protein|nr:PAS domain-containing protein [Bacteroidales bacterium]